MLLSDLFLIPNCEYIEYFDENQEMLNEVWIKILVKEFILYHFCSGGFRELKNWRLNR